MQDRQAGEEQAQCHALSICQLLYSGTGFGRVGPAPAHPYQRQVRTRRLAFGGPLLPLIRVPAVHKLPLVPSGEAVHWRLAFRILGTAPLTFQAFVLLPAKSAVLPGVLSASLSCRPLPPDSNPPACLPQQHLPAAGERLTSLKAQ